MFTYKSKEELIEYLQSFDAKRYAKSRNFVDGYVSYLSPYITHGIITTKECIRAVLQGHSMQNAEKFIMELLRKEFFMQVQKQYGNDFLYNEIRSDKTDIERKKILPQSLVMGETHTDWVNDVVERLQSTGYLHNHQRMWIASWCCHRAKLYWKNCADWTYYHFIDGELSSNHLGRQRVNSTFANKAYIMNERNLQKFGGDISDLDLRGSYSEVADRLFNAERTSQYHNDADCAHALVTPIDQLSKWDQKMFQGEKKIQILTPWRLDETLLSNDVKTIVVLDTHFTQTHSRSHKRLDFIKQYTDRYDVPFVPGSYKEIVQQCREQNIDVVIDERWDPSYRECQQQWTQVNKIDSIPYDRVNNQHSQSPIMKFFQYRNKSKKYIKQLQDSSA